MIKVDLVPSQVDEFAHPQAVPISDQNHRRVSMTPAVVAGRFDQLLDLGRSRMFSGPIGGIGTPSRGDCPIFSCWGYQLERCFLQCFPPWLMGYCDNNRRFHPGKPPQ